METNPTRMCELLVGLPKVSVLGIFGRAGQPLFIHVESKTLSRLFSQRDQVIGDWVSRRRR